jgi:hypothetical protein
MGRRPSRLRVSEHRRCERTADSIAPHAGNSHPKTDQTQTSALVQKSANRGTATKLAGVTSLESMASGTLEAANWPAPCTTITTVQAAPASTL